MAKSLNERLEDLEQRLASGRRIDVRTLPDKTLFAVCGLPDDLRRRMTRDEVDAALEAIASNGRAR